MGTSEFLSALTIVEQDHQLALEKMQALKETVGRLLDPDDRDLPRALERLRELHAYFGTHFESHMEEEEVGLFPLLERDLPDGPERVAKLREEHTDIRRRCEELGNSLQVADELGDDLPVMVLWDLLNYGWDFWEILDNHAHAETRSLHQAIARTLPGGPAAERGGSAPD
jgi:iron-sulfur cluster repair protein YtfE (RIC family)